MKRSTVKTKRSDAVGGTADAIKVETDPTIYFASDGLHRKNGPFYRQVAEIIRRPIASGELLPGQPLPREADLAGHFGVSLITVRQALRDLEGEGLVLKRSAKPTIVAKPKPRTATSFDFQGLAAIIASTEGRRLEVLSYRKHRSRLAQQAFGLHTDEVTYCLQAILHVDDKPVCQNTFYFAPAIGSRLKRSDFDDVVVFRSVQRRLGIQLRGARVSVRAEIADEALARQLDYEVGGPILVIEILYFNTDGEPVELTVNRNRADWFSLNFEAPNDLA